MPPKPRKVDRLSQDLAQAITEFSRVPEKSRWGVRRVVALEFEDDPEPHFFTCDRFERDGMVSLLRGLMSLTIYDAVIMNRVSPQDRRVAKIERLMAGTERLGRIGKEERWLHEASGEASRRESLVPFLVVDSSEAEGRRPKRAVQRRFLAGFRAFTSALREGVLTPTATPKMDRTPTLVVSGSDKAPTWRIEYRHFDLLETDGLVEAPYSTAELTRWKRLDQTAKRLIFLASMNADFLEEAPQRTFFSDAVREKLGGPNRNIFLSYYLEWFSRDWNGMEGGPTILQRILEDFEIVEEERSLIQERVRNSASLYRVDSLLDDETLRLEDIYSGEATDVTDRTLRGMAKPGDYLPLRLIKAGPFHFCQILGTLMTEAILEKAKLVMAQTRKNPAPACFDLEPEVFGRLIDLSLGLSFLE